MRLTLMAAFMVAAWGGVSPCEAQGTPDFGVGVIADTLQDGTPVVLVRVVGADLKPVTAAIRPAQADSAARAIEAGGDAAWALTLHAPYGVVVLRQDRGQPLGVTIAAAGREAGVRLTAEGAANLVRLLDRARALALGASVSNRSADPYGEWNAMRSEH